METFLSFLPNSPLVSFTLILLVILAVPPLFERLRLPGLVGLLVAGLLLGPDVLNLLKADDEMMTLFSDVGKVYLMFVAGLEIDLLEFRKTKDRSLGFGFATFIIPMIVGTVIGQGFGFGLNSSILIGSLLASHTLLGFPIVTRLGVVRNEAVMVTVGATIFTDIAALLVLAICVAVHAGSFSPLQLILQLLALAVYATGVLVGFDWAGREYFRRTGDDESNQFIFILLAIFLASVGAQVIQIDKIVGAFLVGLAVNDVLKHSPVEEKVVFVGSTLFIPFFFVDMGLLIRLSEFLQTLTQHLGLTLAIVGGLIGSKFLAAFVAKAVYRYSWDEMMTMWSLSLPQVAATLAATLAGVEAGLLTQEVFNIVIILMLVTSVLGPVLTNRYARLITVPTPDNWSVPLSIPESSSFLFSDVNHSPDQLHPFRIVVPICNPRTERYLIEMAALVARHQSGEVIPLSITKVNAKTSEGLLSTSLQNSERLLQAAIAVCQEFQVQATSVLRIDHDVALGICHGAREHHANLIMMGWGAKNRIQTRLLGSLPDRVFWSAYCPVAMMRLKDDPTTFHRLLVPIKAVTSQSLSLVRFAQWLAETNQAEVTLLHVVESASSGTSWEAFQSRLTNITAQMKFQRTPHITIVCSSDVVQGISQAAENHDLVILRSQRRRTAGGLAVSDVATRVISEFQGSLILFGETDG